MSNLQAIADRVEIETLRGEFTDAVMMRVYDRLTSLFTHDGAVRMPHINAAAVSREEIRAGIERLQSLWEYFVQTAQPGTIQLEGDTGTRLLVVASARPQWSGRRIAAGGNFAAVRETPLVSRRVGARRPGMCPHRPGSAR
jgi:hypothetical protein